MRLGNVELSYANVVATLALFLALAGGAAIAADKLAKNSVKSKQVKNNTLKSKDLKDGKGVTGADVRDASLSGGDLGPDSVSGSEIAESSLGKVPAATTADSAANAANAQNAANAANAQLLAGLPASALLGSNLVVRVESISVTAGATATDFAECEAGETLISGGGTFDPSTAGDRTVISTPGRNGNLIVTDGLFNEWRYRAFNSTAETRTMRTYAICASQTP